MEKVIKAFPNYKITTEGVVLSKKKGYREFKNGPWIRGEVWKPLKNVLDRGVGYFLVTLTSNTGGTPVRKNQFIHRLLGEAFIPNPEGKAHINHKDGDKTNNTTANLEWATPKENSQHAVDTGLTTHTHCEVQVIQMSKDGSEYIATHKSLHNAYKATGVAFQNISKVVRGIRPRAGGFVWKYAEKK